MTHAGHERDRRMTNDADSLARTLLAWGLAITAHVALVLLAAFITWSLGSTEDDTSLGGPVTIRWVQPGPMLVDRGGGTASGKALSDQRLTHSGNTDGRERIIGVAGGGGGLASLAGPLVTPSPRTWERSISDGVIFALPPAQQARRIVFVVDASGSLIDTLPIVLRDLKKTLRSLDAQQSFTVLLYRKDQVFESPPEGLKRATQGNIEAAMAWLSSERIVPAGQTNPMLALERGLRYQPDLVYLLSDNITGRGRYEVDQARLIADIDRLNISGAQINTIQFLYPDPLTRHGGSATLELIAKRHRGTYRFVQARELELE